MPQYRNGGGNLTVQVSPLGLVELSDEEFEVHGPRLNRYALSWSFYLGNHWSYLREPGEPQVTFNYYKAFSDYHATFTFGRGVDFETPKETSAIVPTRLKRIWEVDNDKRQVLYEMAQQGGVSGDCFVKVAYEEAPDNPELFPPTERRGKVRILVLNAAHVFPEWHPHDRTRFLRVKIKYKFWGTAPEGTRQVFTYTEILTQDLVEEYINDECIAQRPNVLGTVPIVHIPNQMVSGSPWGLADCHDIMALNREYNEKATEIADIINYHAAPVTVVLGAKANNLEKGPKKVWAIPTQGADIKNLEIGDNLQGPMAYLQQVKIAMHEMVGIPESALGQAQPISNTSGVALSIQFQPLMMKWHQKVAVYGRGIEKINELALMCLFLKEPETLAYNETTDGPIRDEQLEVLDPEDPITYLTYAHFPPPLPIDKLIALNEIQMKMTIGLESKRGGLIALGEEFPDEKLEEIRKELIDDAKADGALQLLNAAIQKEIMDLTGLMPSADGPQMPPMMDGPTNPVTGIEGAPVPQTPQPVQDMASILETGAEMNLRTDLVAQAYGTKLPQRRSPEEKPDGE